MENSPFSKLSAELRNEIYDLVIPTDRPRMFGKRSNQDPKTHLAQIISPPLARVCRQMRSEFLPMHFAERHVIYPIEANLVTGDRPLQHLLRWLDLTDLRCHAAISRLEICVNVDMHGWDDYWERWAESWIDLVKELKPWGYGDENLKVTATLLFADRKYRHHQAEEVRIELESIGFALPWVRFGEY